MSALAATRAPDRAIRLEGLTKRCRTNRGVEDPSLHARGQVLDFLGSRSVALGVSSALAAAAYVVSSLAGVVDWVHRLRHLSPIFWSVAQNQVGTGLAGGPWRRWSPREWRSPVCCGGPSNSWTCADESTRQI